MILQLLAAATATAPVAQPVATAAPIVDVAPVSGASVSSPAATDVAPTHPILPGGTPIRLMILREINTHGAKVGDRIKLRVDEPVFIDGKPVVPVGATAWGEISLVQPNGAVGKGGRLTANLLYLDLPEGHVPLQGGYSRKGDGNGTGVVLAVIGFGLPGLLMSGDSGRLKAGDTFTGYVASMPVATEVSSASIAASVNVAR